MRVIKYLIDTNIGMGTFKMLCEFLRLDDIVVNSKLTEEKKELLNNTLNSESFNNWLKIKFSLDRIELNDAQSVIKPLFFDSTVVIDNLLGERILNSLLFLINRGFYSLQKDILLKIISSEKVNLDKISLLKSIKPFSEQKKPTIRTTTTKTSINHKDIDLEDYDDDFSGESSRSSHDPYEDFSWGGLHGEEAYIGYWNTD